MVTMCLSFIRKFEKLDYRERKIKDDIEFLKSCLENYLYPTFLRYKMSSKRLQNSESYKRSQRLFLQEEISFKTVEREKKILFFFYINIYKRRTLWTIKENSSSPLVPDGLILLFA